MTIAATSAKTRQTPGTSASRINPPQRFFAAWQLLPVALVALIAFLTMTPDGMAEPLQDFVGWLVVGGVATVAVMAIVKGLDRVLDCEGS